MIWPKSYDKKLDARDDAIMKAMIENREQYDELIRVRDKFLNNAYELDDGTKVFKSGDGKTVHYRDGSSVPENIIITAKQIPNHHTRIEQQLMVDGDVAAIESEFETLENARIESNQLRERIDGARERIGDARDQAKSGNMTVNKIEDLDAEILDLTPSDDLSPLPVAAAKHLADATLSEAPNLKTSFATSSNLAAPTAPTSAPATQFGFDN